MNKTALKNFAIAARLELLQRVMNRANIYGVNEETCKNHSIDRSSGFQKLGGELLTHEEEIQRDALIHRINLQGYRQTMEEAAYTWFNRLIALRYMQEHRLLPVRERVLPEIPGQMPEIIREAHQLSMEGVDSALVLDLLDRNDTTTLYRYLLIFLCNALHDPLPLMFEKLSDYTELLFPDGLLKDDSVLAALAKIPAEDFQDIQVIGWLYQYYNTQLKDETFELLKKNVKITKERIGAATQLFTPEWIVRYMVENSLGRLWQEGHHDENLRMKWRYYMDEAQQEPAVAAQLAERRKGLAALQSEQIRLLDPCMGSGHILVYAFDVLMDIYRSMGYTDRDAVQSIIENNLYGLDIDDRAAQLAYFAVMMKACEYDRRFLRRGVQPHVWAIAESANIEDSVLNRFGAEKALAKRLLGTFRDAKEYGSILHVDLTEAELDRLAQRTAELKTDEGATLTDMADRASAAAAIEPLLEQARILARAYDVVVTNPPYMGSSGMNEKLSRLVKEEYPDSKSDLFAVFIERCGDMLNETGYQAMITQHAWMFLSSYEKLRGKLQGRELINMAHLGPRAFEEIGGEVVQTTAFVMQKEHITNYKGCYARLIEPTTQDGKEEMFLAETNRYTAQQENFKKIPGMPVAYWVSENFNAIFSKGTPLENYANARQGMKTCDNDRFIRLWHEVDINRCCFDASSLEDAKETGCRWFPLNHGGAFKQYYGNNCELVNWENDGNEMKALAMKKYGCITRTITNINYYFKEGLTWTVISSASTSFRRYYRGHLFSNSGQSIVPDDSNVDLDYLLGLLNSKVVNYILSVLSPTIGFESGYLKLIPIIYTKESVASNFARQNISFAKDDWDSFETSWDFKKHPMI